MLVVYLRTWRRVLAARLRVAGARVGRGRITADVTDGRGQRGTGGGDPVGARPFKKYYLPLIFSPFKKEIHHRRGASFHLKQEIHHRRGACKACGVKFTSSPSVYPRKGKFHHLSQNEVSKLRHESGVVSSCINSLGLS